MTKAQIRKNAFLKSIPIMCSYIFVSMAYGIMMDQMHRLCYDMYRYMRIFYLTTIQMELSVQ